jgi:hypothetical protein
MVGFTSFNPVSQRETKANWLKPPEPPPTVKKAASADKSLSAAANGKA